MARFSVLRSGSGEVDKSTGHVFSQLAGCSDYTVNLNAAKMMFREMDIVGSLGCRPVDYPNIIRMVAEGRVKVEPVVTHRFGLDAINEAPDVPRRGEGLRTIIVM